MDQQDTTLRTILDVIRIDAYTIVSTLFGYLDVKTKLRLRRVCNQMKDVVNDNIKIKISQQDVKFSSADSILNYLGVFGSLPMQHCSYKFLFPNEPMIQDHFPRDLLQSFVDECESNVTRLHISTLSLPLSGDEVEFLEGLPNLLHLTVDRIVMSSENTRSAGEINRYPNVFATLNSFRINQIDTNSSSDSDSVLSKKNRDQLWTMYRFCKSLNQFSFPPEMRRGWSTRDFYIMSQCTMSNRMPKVWDLGEDEVMWDAMYHQLGRFSVKGPYYTWARMLRHCSENGGIQFQNMPGTFISKLCCSHCDTDHFEGFTQLVLSLRDVDIICLTTEFTNMVEIVLRTDNTGIRLCAHEEKIEPPVWPNLKSMTLVVDIDYEAYWIGADPLKHIYHALFGHGQRDSLTTLHLTRISPKFEDYIPPPPRLKDIARACPNLTTLTLVNLRTCSESEYKRYSLWVLWRGLCHLRSVTLDACLDISDHQFIGDSMDEPDFLRLEELEKLTITQMHRISGITDNLFQSVLSKTKLRKLSLISKDESSEIHPLSSVTKEGIGSLLTGSFAESIENFSFKTFSISGLSQEDLNQLAMKFRSSDF